MAGIGAHPMGMSPGPSGMSSLGGLGLHSLAPGGRRVANAGLGSVQSIYAGSVSSMGPFGTACAAANAASHLSAAFNYLRELFHGQEELMEEMLEVCEANEAFQERMQIVSPVLRTWFGLAEGEELWHRVQVTRIRDPITQQPLLCISQVDITDVVEVERQVVQLQQQQASLLREILPQQVIEHLLIHKAIQVAKAYKQGGDPVQQSTITATASAASQGTLLPWKQPLQQKRSEPQVMIRTAPRPGRAAKEAAAAEMAAAQGADAAGSTGRSAAAGLEVPGLAESEPASADMALMVTKRAPGEPRPPSKEHSQPTAAEIREALDSLKRDAAGKYDRSEQASTNLASSMLAASACDSTGPTSNGWPGANTVTQPPSPPAEMAPARAGFFSAAALSLKRGMRGATSTSADASNSNRGPSRPEPSSANGLVAASSPSATTPRSSRPPRARRHSTTCVTNSPLAQTSFAWPALDDASVLGPWAHAMRGEHSLALGTGPSSPLPAMLGRRAGLTSSSRTPMTSTMLCARGSRPSRSPSLITGLTPMGSRVGSLVDLTTLSANNLDHQSFIRSGFSVSMSGAVHRVATSKTGLLTDQAGDSQADASESRRPSTPSMMGGGPMHDETGRIWLTQQDVMNLATFHEDVTILFADIKGFTQLSNQLHPSQVMLFLNSLYSVWDSLLETFGVYKVETIGDSYMAAAGLFCHDPITNTKRLGGHDPQHAAKILGFAKAMLWSSQSIKTPLGEPVNVRVGVHSGPCMSGVVGQRMPRFCLFGDSVNTASRMESNGYPGCIHASHTAYDLLPAEHWVPTGGIMAKGKGMMETWILPVLPGAAAAAQAAIAASAQSPSQVAAAATPPQTSQEQVPPLVGRSNSAREGGSSSGARSGGTSGSGAADAAGAPAATAPAAVRHCASLGHDAHAGRRAVLRNAIGDRPWPGQHMEYLNMPSVVLEGECEGSSSKGLLEGASGIQALDMDSNANSNCHLSGIASGLAGRERGALPPASAPEAEAAGVAAARKVGPTGLSLLQLPGSASSSAFQMYVEDRMSDAGSAADIAGSSAGGHNTAVGAARLSVDASSGRPSIGSPVARTASLKAAAGPFQIHRTLMRNASDRSATFHDAMEGAADANEPLRSSDGGAAARAAAAAAGSSSQGGNSARGTSASGAGCPPSSTSSVPSPHEAKPPSQSHSSHTLPVFGAPRGCGAAFTAALHSAAHGALSKEESDTLLFGIRPPSGELDGEGQWQMEQCGVQVGGALRNQGSTASMYSGDHASHASHCLLDSSAAAAGLVDRVGSSDLVGSLNPPSRQSSAALMIRAGGLRGRMGSKSLQIERSPASVSSAAARDPAQPAPAHSLPPKPSVPAPTSGSSPGAKPNAGSPAAAVGAEAATAAAAAGAAAAWQSSSLFASSAGSMASLKTQHSPPASPPAASGPDVHLAGSSASASPRPAIAVLQRSGGSGAWTPGTTSTGAGTPTPTAAAAAALSPAAAAAIAEADGGLRRQDSAQRLVDSVTSRVLQQLQASRPESPATPFGVAPSSGSRRSIDVGCLRSRTSCAGLAGIGSNSFAQRRAAILGGPGALSIRPLAGSKASLQLQQSGTSSALGGSGAATGISDTPTPTSRHASHLAPHPSGAGYFVEQSTDSQQFLVGMMMPGNDSGVLAASRPATGPTNNNPAMGLTVRVPRGRPSFAAPCSGSQSTTNADGAGAAWWAASAAPAGRRPPSDGYAIGFGGGVSASIPVRYASQASNGLMDGAGPSGSLSATHAGMLGAVYGAGTNSPARMSVDAAGAMQQTWPRHAPRNINAELGLDQA